MVLQILAPLIPYFGIFVGVYIAHLTFEELASGRKLFAYVSKTMLFVILLVLSVLISSKLGIFLIFIPLALLALLVYKYNLPLFLVCAISPFVFLLPKPYMFVCFSLLLLHNLALGTTFVKKESQSWSIDALLALQKTYIYIIAYVLVVVLSFIF